MEPHLKILNPQMFLSKGKIGRKNGTETEGKTIQRGGERKREREREMEREEGEGVRENRDRMIE